LYAVIDAEGVARVEEDLVVVAKALGVFPVGEGADKLQLDHFEEGVGGQEERAD
jgi:hypothetical protein